MCSSDRTPQCAFNILKINLLQMNLALKHMQVKARNFQVQCIYVIEMAGKFKNKSGKGDTDVHKKKFDGHKKKEKKSAKLQSEIDELKARYVSINPKLVKSFSDFPLSPGTVKALTEAKYVSPTEIQKEAIGFALQGKDVLGAAKTGSGKTLAFLVPILEKLYSLRWTRSDGGGALIITPTRELAYQIFETLRRVGKYHEFSAGLVIGGKDLKFEWSRMADCNIIICTPGRLLQHLDENPAFSLDNLRMLVLDEADRCLDLGFKTAMNAIVSSLPKERQTLLFSATQTRSVTDLARLSLVSPVLVSVHEHSNTSTPDGLQQSYIVTDQQNKLNILWSFLKAHRRKKTIAFLSSCKQVKYFCEVLKLLKPGMSVMGLHGGLHQLRRMAVYDGFCEKDAAVLLATDIAARGLDFPGVDWVVQVDCPEDARVYTHRAGRTARYNSSGESLLVMTPSEEAGMVKQLGAHKIPATKIEVNPSKQQSIQGKVSALVAGDRHLKESAQRAFLAYLKSVFIMKDKTIFKVESVDLDAFAESLGLSTPPALPWFLLKHGSKGKISESGSKEDVEADDSDTDAPSKEESLGKLLADDDDSDDEIFKVKRQDHAIEGEEVEETKLQESAKKGKNKVVTKAQVAKKLMKKKIQANTKVTFDESGDTVEDATKQKVSEAGKKYEDEANDRVGGGIDISKAKEVMAAEDKFDRATERARIREKHKEEKRKKKEENRRLPKGSTNDGESEESDDDDGSEPDLSWLPDPDKIYGKDPGDGKESESSSDDEEVEVKEGKRKVTVVRKVVPKKRKTESSDEDVIDTGLSLGDDEDLALRLLGT